MGLPIDFASPRQLLGGPDLWLLREIHQLKTPLSLRRQLHCSPKRSMLGNLLCWGRSEESNDISSLLVRQLWSGHVHVLHRLALPLQRLRREAQKVLV